MESGLFVTFFEPDDDAERGLPPVGPLHHVVIRHHQLLAERGTVQHSPAMGDDIARWLEAELELQRALGVEPGGPKRGELRVTARDGVFVRFTVLGDDRERDPVPELGPFAVVRVGRRAVEANGTVLATRAASDLAAWQLTSAAGDAAGLRKPDVALRASGDSFHPRVAPIGGVPEATPEPPPPPPPPPREVYTPAAATVPDAPPEEPPALTPGDRELIERIERERDEDTLRARMRTEERRRLGVDDAAEPATTWAMRYRTETAAAEPPPTVAPGEGAGDLRDLLWRLRFAIVGLLLVAVGAYGFAVVRGGGTAALTGQTEIRRVGVAERVSGTRWDYIVNGTQRVSSAGNATPRGEFYVVRLGVTNKGSAGAQLSPSDFVLIDANGNEYRAESAGSGPYYSSSNTQSQYVWPGSFAVGRTTTIAVIFDVAAGLPRGNLLLIAELPNVRVKLD